MSAQRHQSNQDILKNFIPLNTLPTARLTSISEKHHVEELSKGTVLFEQGDEAKEFIYLVSGMISLYAGEMEVETIVTGSEVARFAIAHHLPRKVKAVTRSKARIVRIPTHLLDMDTPDDDGDTYMVDEVEDQGGDWMTTMLQSPVFQRLPAANLQKVMMQMEEVAFASGDVVVKQGDEADFYYIIKAGDCELIRQSSKQARPIKLGELHSCDAFGEDALLSGNPRNVTVRMKGKGQMLRLSKANFIKLVKEPVLQYVKLEEGQAKVANGANWLDVRGADEFAEDHIEGAINIPFFSLRMKVAELRHDQLQVLVCANGRTSEAAAFLLLKFGFNALILKGGMAKWVDGAGVKEALDKPSAAADKLAPTEETATVSAVVSAPDKANSEKIQDQQNKIKELEKLCAQSNEKLNKLTIERDKLQQQYEQQSNVVSELQLSSQLIADELAASGASNEGREAEVDQLLALEREKVTTLETELGQFRESIDILSEEVSVKDDELITLNDALKEAEKQKEKIADELAQQIAESLQNTSSSVAAKESRISELTEEVNQLQSNLANIEQTKTAQEASLLEQAAELKQVKEHEKKAVEALKAESVARAEEYEDELSFLKQALSEKTENLDEQEKLTEEFKSQIESLKEKNQHTEAAINEKSVEIGALIDQLKVAESSIETLQERQADTESTLLEKEASLTSYEEKLAFIDAERSDLNKTLEQSDHELSNSLAKQAGLEKQLSEALILTDELKSNEVAALTQVDRLKKQHEQAEGALEKTVEELTQSEAQIEKLEQESEMLSEQVKRLKASLNEISSGKESIESELAQRLDDLDTKLASALEDKQSLEKQLETVSNEKEQVQQELLALKGQLDAGLGGQRELNEELTRVREELEVARQEGEKDKAAVSELLLQANARVEEVEAELNQLSEERVTAVQQLVEVENNLVELEEVKAALELALDKTTSEKELVQRQVEVSKDEQRQLKEQHVEQLSQLEKELEQVNSDHLSNNAELASMLAENNKLQQKVVDAESMLLVSSEEKKELLAKLREAQLELAEFKSGLESKQADVDVLEGQVAEFKKGDQQSEQEMKALAERFQAVEKDFSLMVTKKEGLLLQLEEVKQSRLLDDEATKTLQQTVSNLEQSLQQLEEEKEQLITNAEKESADLSQKLKDAERLAAENSDNGADQARIRELEEELNEASTKLLDLEIKMEATVMGRDADSNELKALQSELNLVREQTEKDIQAMQMQVEKSEKMNLALKKKVISMQTLANQDVLPEQPIQGKKKGWWK